MPQAPAYTPKSYPVTLKDGRVALVRPVTAADALELLAVDRAVHTDGRGTVLMLDELPSDEVAMLLRMKAVPEGLNGAMLCVELGGRVAGFGTVKRRRLAQMQHVASVDLAVHTDAQGLGIGRLLMEAMLRWVHEQPGAPITRVELNVLADNERAIPLYESLGFECEGRHRNFIRRAHGEYADDLMMALLLPDA